MGNKGGLKQVAPPLTTMKQLWHLNIGYRMSKAII